MYTEKEAQELVNKMIDYLTSHEIYKLMELVTSAIATKETSITYINTSLHM
jgi:hypothetical protein